MIPWWWIPAGVGGLLVLCIISYVIVRLLLIKAFTGRWF